MSIHCALCVQACRSFSDGGECVRGCLPEYVYNSEDHSLTVNTEQKLTAGYFCVDRCPGVCGACSHAHCVSESIW